VDPKKNAAKPSEIHRLDSGIDMRKTLRDIPHLRIILNMDATLPELSLKLAGS
jgi:hypothetical protein